MLRKLMLPVAFLILGYGFWVSEDFKTIAAGVAVFLFGMISLEEGFKTFTGGTLERKLRRSTSNVPKSMLFGVVTTSIMQSSSLVSVITMNSVERLGLAEGKEAYAMVKASSVMITVDD